MSHRSYAVLLAAAIAAWCAFLGAYSLSLEPLSGDLARIGRFDEADFGPRAGQLRFSRPLFETAPPRLAHDVVVLGDSLSHDAASGWQNFMALETGETFAVFHWKQRKWEDLLSDPGYREHPPKVFIFQTFERSLKEHAREGPCGGLIPPPRPSLAPRRRPAETFVYRRPVRARLSDVNLSYALDSMVARARRRLGLRSGEAMEVSLERPLFSSRKADAALIFRDDLLKGAWTRADLDAVSCGLRRLQDAVQGDGRTLFLAVLVPDKLSAYSGDLKDRSLAGLGVLDRLDLEGVNVVPVGARLTEAVKAGTVDVYLPDDSHLGSAGYAIMARSISSEVQRRAMTWTESRVSR